MKRFFGFFLLSLLFFFPAAAFAATPLSTAAAGFLSTFVFPLLSAFLLGLISWAVSRISKKWHLDFLIKNEGLIEKAAYRGITYTEEIAARRVKESALKLTGNEKLDLAVSQVLAAAPELSREQASGYVHSLLARLPGVGATGERTVK